MRRAAAILVAAVLAASAAGAATHYVRPDGTPPGPPPIAVLPADVPWDYQIGSPYAPPDGVGVVARDWFEGQPAGGYDVCYVNAFQTQADDPDVDRPDELGAWPQDLVLRDLGDDPGWGGEYLVDISTADRRDRALDWLRPMIETCAAKGFDAVELDNLDSWTRFDGTPLEAQVPFGREEAVAFAADLAAAAHAMGLAVAQKNTVELDRATSRDVVGFDLAVVEECGAYDECEGYAAVFDDRVLAVEYTDDGFAAACAAVGDRISVVRRDRAVSGPDGEGYVYAEC